MFYITENALSKAYKEACAKGSDPSYRAKVNLYGHERAGKTSFFNRLMGENIDDDEESTEGISTHLIKTTFSEDDLRSDWSEVTFNTDEILDNFNGIVLSRVEKLSNESALATKASVSNVPRSDIKQDTESASMLQEQTVDSIKDPVLSKEALSGKLKTHSKDIPKDVKESTEELKGKTDEIKMIENINNNTMKQLLSHKQKPVDNTKPCTIRLWDHGGQDEFIATHHFFLDAESTNMIVMDISRNLRHPLKEGSGRDVPKTPLEFLHYWLNAIDVKSKEAGIQPSIALVLTHKDKIPSQNAQVYIEQYVDEVMKAVEEKEYTPYISKQNIFVVDNKHADQREFIKIKSKLFKMMTQQKSWGSERPVRWLKLEADMHEKAKEGKVKFLNTSNVQELAQAYGMSKEELDSFLKFHHKLGDFVHYPEPGLKDLVIIDPQWLVDAFKALVTGHEFLDKRSIPSQFLEQLKHGIVTDDGLQALWEGNDAEFLQQLMVKFDLMFTVEDEGKKFLVPCMLPPQDVNIYDTEPFRNMELVYNESYKPNQGDKMLIGTFHKLLPKCSKVEGWNICAKDHLSYTDTSFEIGTDIRLALTLDKNKEIRASIWCPRKKLDFSLRPLIIKTRKHLQPPMTSLSMKPDNNMQMMCPHCLPADDVVCLVRVKEMQGCTFEPKDELCVIHRKQLEPRDFTWSQKGIKKYFFCIIKTQFVYFNGCYINTVCTYSVRHNIFTVHVHINSNFIKIMSVTA